MLPRTSPDRPALAGERSLISRTRRRCTAFPRLSGRTCRAARTRRCCCPARSTSARLAACHAS